MKSFKRILAGCAMLLAVMVPSAEASAQSLLGDALGNMLQGVFSKSDLSVYDICGQWTSTGSAVSFQSDNFLQKAGGTAAAGVIENKINPYFEKLGFNNAVLTVEADSTFTLKTQKFTLNGNLTSNGDGTFDFTFTAMKKIKLGTVKTYVQKSGNNMDVMFDAKKLKSLISGIAKFTGISIAKTAASVLDSYDGLCVGFSMKKTGDVEMPEGTTNKSGLGGLLQGVLGGGNSSSSSTSNSAVETESTSTQESSSSSSSKSGLGGLLEGILSGGKSSSSSSSSSTTTEEVTRSTENTESQTTSPDQKYTKIGGGMLKGETSK